jgi:hypothetical protein
MQRPTSVFVLAILNLIWGGLAAVGSLCFGGITVASPYLMGLSGPPGGTPPRMPPVFLGYVVVTTALTFVLSAVLVRTGLGLLRMRPWARTWCLAVAWANLAATAADLAVQETVLRPHTQQYLADVRRWQGATPAPSPVAVQAGTDMGTVLGVVSNYAVSVFFVLFSLVQLAILLRPSVRAAFARQGP